MVSPTSPHASAFAYSVENVNVPAGSPVATAIASRGLSAPRRSNNFITSIAIPK